MQSHEVDYVIHGDDLQFVEIALDPAETVIAEAGAMMYMDDGITFEAKMGDGSEPEGGMWGKLKSAAKRAMSGEGLFMTHFTNEGGGRSSVAFAADFPGKVIPVDLGELGGRLICQRQAFLAAAFGTTIGFAFQKKIGAGFFGGEGFILQDLQGDGLVFLHAGGSVVERHLQGESLRVDTGCVVAFEPGIDYTIERAGNLKSQFLGGEGIFLTTLSGTGRVWLQSMQYATLARKIVVDGGAALKEDLDSTSNNPFD
ncbi:MAG: TIGR00266 family protein [Acidimicrobiia bacterium]|nr:TIGR00266 family protein [Acidimicrobiia bacterium]